MLITSQGPLITQQIPYPLTSLRRGSSLAAKLVQLGTGSATVLLMASLEKTSNGQLTTWAHLQVSIQEMRVVPLGTTASSWDGAQRRFTAHPKCVGRCGWSRFSPTGTTEEANSGTASTTSNGLSNTPVVALSILGTREDSCSQGLRADAENAREKTNAVQKTDGCSERNLRTK
jgi:hypothetical protein